MTDATSSGNGSEFHLEPEDEQNGGECDSLEINKTIDSAGKIEKFDFEREFSDRTKIDLEFEDIRFTVKKWTLTKKSILEKKEILKGVSGKFSARKLTAVMGPSGAGKSSLLDILAAFNLKGVSGNVRLNNKERNGDDLKEFKRLCCYIQQDDCLRMELKVHEAMKYAADLKMGSAIAKEIKNEQIKGLLELLGLIECWDRPTKGLSGGQKKRLSIALELLSDPPIIFLDEPTTGLDSSSCSQCVSLLKLLAKQGRTVVCTIHQPSALIFELFDHLYALSNGECIYSGDAKNLVGYLARMNLNCPKYHNPADFLLEVASGEYGADLNSLATAAKTCFDQSKSRGERDDRFFEDGKKDENFNDHDSPPEIVQVPSSPPSFVAQFWLLYCRKFLMMKRSPSNVAVRAAAHLLIALIFGYLYKDVGAKASTVLANYCYMYGSNLFVVYTGKMSVIMLFPLELHVVTREYFNRWYHLGPYYLSMILTEMPFQIICCCFYLPVSYYLTGQPLDWNRFLHFSITATASSLAAQACGFLISITTPKKIAVFIGPVVACLLSVFGFCLRFADTPLIFRWLYHISYFRASFQNSVHSVYGLNRSTLACDDFYCHFRNPKKFLLEMDMTEIYVDYNFALVFIWIVILHVLTVIAVWRKLNRR